MYLSPVTTYMLNPTWLIDSTDNWKEYTCNTNVNNVNVEWRFSVYIL